MKKIIEMIIALANLSIDKADEMADAKFFLSTSPLSKKLFSRNLWYCITFTFKLFSLVVIFALADYSLSVASFIFWKKLFIDLLFSYVLIIVLFFSVAIYQHVSVIIDKRPLVK